MITIILNLINKVMEGILISELKEKKIIDGSEIIPVESKNQNYNINVNNLKNFINDIEITDYNLLFDTYENKDELAGQIGELKTEVAVLKATRPYQDALIQCDIRRVAEHADFNLWRRTCRMISGEVVLPNTPTVTGYASYNPCDCRNNSTQTPAA